MIFYFLLLNKSEIHQYLYDSDKNIYIDEDEFNNFKYCHIVLDIVVIILFILNVFDLNI